MSDERTVELLTQPYFYDRLRRRLEGLRDEELVWTPTDDPDISIAWRLGHIGDLLREERNWRWLGREPALLDADRHLATTADAAIAYVDEAWSAWQALLGSLTVDELWAPIGPVAGPYAATERIDLVLHVVDELIHHAAEVGLLRDLYAATVTP